MARTPLIRTSAAVGALLAALVLTPAASAATVSLWHMDETSGTTMGDSVGTNNGTLRAVNLGQPGLLGSSYGFPGQPSIVTVPSSASLNPGSASFSVTLSFKTSVVTRDDSADISRKGTTTNSKTLWKMELRPSSTRKTEQIRCYFRGSSQTIGIYGGKPVSDGAWHTVTCIKQADQVAIVLDGKTHTKAAHVGSISNSAPLTIGAKATNDDAYQGLVDEMSFAR